MKIGVITYWWSDDNYGQILQAYALQAYLKAKGHDVFLIKYKEKPIVEKKSFLSKVLSLNIEKVKKKIHLRKVAYIKKKYPRHFGSFKAQYLKFSKAEYDSYASLLANPPEADMYICGSDQVWNSSFRKPIEPYLLDFGDAKVKRISYAASFGMTKLSDIDKEIFNKCLANFDGISVRERTGVQICNDLGYRDVKWVSDPTLLLNRNEWLRIADFSMSGKTDKMKVLVYTLNKTIADKDKIIQDLKNRPNTDVRHITANNDISGDTYPSINQWIGLISESDFIVTNSFHGMVFCIIFNKRFVVLPTTASFEGMNDRIESLLYRCKLEDHILKEFDQELIEILLKKNIDWQTVNTEIRNWQKDTFFFFEEMGL